LYVATDILEEGVTYMFYPEGGGGKYLSNVVNHLQEYSFRTQKSAVLIFIAMET
jgi:hypothetical protein